MKIVKIDVYPDEVLDELDVREVIDYYGVDGILEKITDAEYLRQADIDLLLEKIEDMHEGRINEYLTERE